MTSVFIQKFKDPVCGMLVNVTDKTPSTTLEGRRYYFCCPRCKHDFMANSRKYFGGRGRLNRWLEKIARANEKEFGGKPSCH
jgi:YHS domain-containing protein